MTFNDLMGRTWDENRLFSVLIELTYRCNLDCFFCYNDLGLRGKPLSYDQYDALLQDLASMNVLNVALSGGEPLAHPDFFRIGARARELGFLTRVKSNGHALRGDLARRLRDEVDPFVIEVSLHGATAVTHDKQTRVPGSFVRLVENLHEMNTLGMRVKINSTLTLWNETETAEMYALADSIGLPLRFDLQVSPRDDGDRTPLNVSPTDAGIRDLMRIEDARMAQFASTMPEPVISAEAPEPSAKHCGAGSAAIAIDPYGNIYPCVQWRRAVANLHERSVSEIWGHAFDGIRAETEDAKKVVTAHPRGKWLNFCPGLAEVLTGSATTVPAEMERIATVVAPG
ncbi:MAG TPA: radical SAM protein [Thermoanaerobaculia bacterium]|nr:radical SAM protein [Thermoanaerobaculia bacterium]